MKRFQVSKQVVSKPLFSKDKRDCLICGKTVTKLNHDHCYACFSRLVKDEEMKPSEHYFIESIDQSKIHTVYVMSYGQKYKVGYTHEINSRLAKIKMQYPNNKLIYFREFSKESEARRYEVWFKELSEHKKLKIITQFQDKLRKVELV